MANDDTDTQNTDTGGQSAAQVKLDAITGVLSDAADILSPITLSDPNIIPLVGISVTASRHIASLFDAVTGNTPPVDPTTGEPDSLYLSPTRLY